MESIKCKYKTCRFPKNTWRSQILYLSAACFTNNDYLQLFFNAIILGVWHTFKQAMTLVFYKHTFWMWTFCTPITERGNQTSTHSLSGKYEWHRRHLCRLDTSHSNSVTTLEFILLEVNIIRELWTITCGLYVWSVPVTIMFLFFFFFCRIVFVVLRL